eukprot:2774902-Prymnesium_polylepis.1
MAPPSINVLRSFRHQFSCASRSAVVIVHTFTCSLLMTVIINLIITLIMTLFVVLLFPPFRAVTFIRTWDPKLGFLPSCGRTSLWPMAYMYGAP